MLKFLKRLFSRRVDLNTIYFLNGKEVSREEYLAGGGKETEEAMKRMEEQLWEFEELLKKRRKK